MKSSYDNLQNGIRDLDLPKIKRWENKYPDKDYTVSVKTDEFTCICPKTGLPDYAVISIDYIPDRYCVELKSFKLYLLAYRNIGIFHEHVINRILDDFIGSCKPRYAKIVGEFSLRGGIKTTVSREYETRRS
jgi:7-cyano-7-deazaguanine reductase